MPFQVDLSPSALNDAEAAFLRIQKQAPGMANDWFNGLLLAVYSLENFPNRCPLAPESQEIGLLIRQLLYQSHRIVFIVVPSENDDAVDGNVQVLRIRHHAQERLKPYDL